MFLNVINFFVFYLCITISCFGAQYVVLDDLESSSGEAYERYLSKVPLAQRTLITSKENMSEPKLSTLSKIFSEIIFIETNKQYHFTSTMETLVIDLHKTRGIQRIITSPVEEVDIERAADLRGYLGLLGQSYESAVTFRNKLVMKDLAIARGFKVPDYKETNVGLDLIRFSEKHEFPLVVKPRNGMGSMSTTIIKDSEELKRFVCDNYNAFYRSNFMVESFVRGRVYQVDGIYSNDRIIAWPSVYINSCLEMAVERKILGSHLLEGSNPLTKMLIDYAERLLTAFPTTEQMPFHLEVFVTSPDQEIIFCEIASRVGGYVNENWKLGFGFDLEQTFVESQAGLQEEIREMKLVSPLVIPGWLLFPAESNKTIEHIETECPLHYCKAYKSMKKNGDHIASTLGICSNLALAYIISDSEDDFMAKSSEMITWFKESLKYLEK